MIKINLLSPSLIKKEERKEILFLAYAVVIISLIVCLCQYGLKFNSYNTIMSRITNLEQELSKYESIVKQIETIQSAKAILETKKNVINTLMTERLFYPVFMEDFLQKVPSNVWLKSISTQITQPGSMNISLNAEALDNYSIADFFALLSSSSDFIGLELGPISVSASKESVISAFSLTFQYQKKKS